MIRDVNCNTVNNLLIVMVNKYYLKIILYFLMNINNVRTAAGASIIHTLVFVAPVDVLRWDLSAARQRAKAAMEISAEQRLSLVKTSSGAETLDSQPQVRPACDLVRVHLSGRMRF